MERVSWIAVERSMRVEEDGRVKVWGVPWWVIVVVMGASSGSGRA